MYLYLGENTVTAERDIIGVFDIENASLGRHTKEFLAQSEKRGRVFNVSYDMPKSFAVCVDKNGKETVYISHISAAVLRKRELFHTEHLR